MTVEVHLVYFVRAALVVHRAAHNVVIIITAIRQWIQGKQLYLDGPSASFDPNQRAKR